MKKTLSLILIISLALSICSLSACGLRELFESTTATTPEMSMTQTTTSTTSITTTIKPAPPAPESVENELKWEIIDDYLLWSGILDDKKPEEIDCEFFGRYGDCVAVYFHTAGSYGELLQRYDTAGYRFIYPDSRVIQIWNDGAFYTISEAYEMGFIVESDVESINYLFQSFEFKEPYFTYQTKSEDYISISQSFDGNYVTVYLDPGICREGKKFPVEFFRGVDFERVELFSERGNGDELIQIYHVYLKYPSKENALNAVKILMKIDGISRAYPENWNGWGAICSIDDTYYFESTYAIDNNEIPVLSLNDRRIWNFTDGSDAVKVGVIDTGIASHDDLNDNYYLALDFYEYGNNLDESQRKDTRSHGTHVAGIVGGIENDEGIVGVNKNVSLVQLRTGDYDIEQTYAIDAINWVVENWNTENQIKILNCSFRFIDENTALEEAILDFTELGGLLICAAGNDNKDIEPHNEHIYPASYGNTESEYCIENIIVVGGLNSAGTDQWTSGTESASLLGSNWGINTVDIYATGENILSTVPLELCNVVGCILDHHSQYGYHSYSGTSMATPIVSGTAALLWSIAPALTATQIKNCIIYGADEISVSIPDGTSQTVRKLNVWGAFKYLINNYCPISSVTLSDSPLMCRGTISSDGDYFVDNTYLQKFVASTSGFYNFVISSSSPIEVTFYDENFDVKTINYTTTGNGNMVEFIYEVEAGSIYYVKSRFTNTVLIQTDITINVYQHTHEYGSWTYKDGTTHVKECENCHYQVVGAHAVKVSEVLDGIGRCLYCGSLINLNDDFSQIIHNAQKVSINGSYILPSGIIVLVDEDVEAYESGTLVFYDRDDLPVGK